MSNLKKVKIDEIELCLNFFKVQFPEKVKNSTYKQLADLVRENFQVECSEQDIFLIHEPSIEQEEYDMEYFYRNVLGIE